MNSRIISPDGWWLIVFPDPENIANHDDARLTIINLADKEYEIYHSKLPGESWHYSKWNRIAGWSPNGQGVITTGAFPQLIDMQSGRVTHFYTPPHLKMFDYWGHNAAVHWERE